MSINMILIFCYCAIKIFKSFLWIISFDLNKTSHIKCIGKVRIKLQSIGQFNI